MASCWWQIPLGPESSYLHSCMSFHQCFDGCALFLYAFQWIMYKSTISSLIFTVLVKVSLVRPFSCSPRNITAAVDSSHCSGLPVSILTLFQMSTDANTCILSDCTPTVLLANAHLTFLCYYFYIPSHHYDRIRHTIINLHTHLKLLHFNLGHSCSHFKLIRIKLDFKSSLIRIN